MEGIPRLKQHFGQVLSKLRLEKGESQQVVADNCNFERAYVSRLERGISEPSISTIFKIAEYFDLSPADLIDKVHSMSRKHKK